MPAASSIVTHDRSSPLTYVADDGAMRITVLQQQVKTLKDEQPKIGEEVARELESIKHFLWHGNTFQALQRLESLLIDLEFPEVPSPLTQKVAKGIG